MTKLMRLIAVSAVVVTSPCLWAQDEDLDDLLGGGAEEAATPAEPVVAEPAAEPAAEEPAPEPEVAEEPAETPAEESAPAEEPAPASNESLLADTTATDDSLLTDASAEDEPMLDRDPAKLTTVYTPEERMANELFAMERLRYEALLKHGKDCFERGVEFKKQKAWNSAITKFEEAETYLKNRDGQLEERARLLKRDCHYLWAKDLYAQGRYDEALAQTEKANVQGHPFATRLRDQITETKNNPVKAPVPPTLPYYATEEYKASRELINDRIKRATVFFNVGNYLRANEQIELVLRDDPHNEAAIDLRSRIAKRYQARSEAQKISTHDLMVAQVQDSWTPRGALALDSPELTITGIDKTTAEPVQEADVSSMKVIEDKLNYIRLPEFSLAPPATLADAVDLFSQMSDMYDKPELPPERRGISFMLKWDNAPAGETTDEFADPSASGLPPIQKIRLTWTTLKEALDAVCDVTGARYVIKGSRVMIVPSASALGSGRMISRNYNVTSSFNDRINEIAAEAAEEGTSDSSSSGGGWGDSGGSSLADGGNKSAMAKAALEYLGVEFPAQAKIAYIASMGQLRVTNTEENLAVLEGVLELINVTPTQIEIEARFVEVSQSDLNSLGFEWMLNQNVTTTVGDGINWGSSQHSSGSAGGYTYSGDGTTVSTGKIFNSSVNGGSGASNLGIHGGANTVNQGMRFINKLTGTATEELQTSDQFMEFSGVFGKLDVSMILHMLSQRTDTDMLSSPKVLTKPGNEAVMKVVRRYRYPTDFSIETLDINNNNNNNNGGGAVTQPLPYAVEPSNFEEEELGVILQVVPELSSEGQMINLTVEPVVRDLDEILDYGMEVPIPKYEASLTGEQVLTGYEYTLLKMPQPVFSERKVSTALSVYNGATVVMGGLITETRKAIDDKVPILGDLPFVGFLFRSTADYSEKRNLLIFLTARVVDPAGRPVRVATDAKEPGGYTTDTSAPAPTAPATVDAAN